MCFSGNYSACIFYYDNIFRSFFANLFVMFPSFVCWYALFHGCNHDCLSIAILSFFTLTGMLVITPALFASLSGFYYDTKLLLKDASFYRPEVLIQIHGALFARTVESLERYRVQNSVCCILGSISTALMA